MVEWVNRLTFSTSSPPSPPSPPSPSHFQLFVSVRYRKRHGGGVGIWQCMPSCFFFIMMNMILVLEYFQKPFYFIFVPYKFLDFCNLINFTLGLKYSGVMWGMFLLCQCMVWLEIGSLSIRLHVEWDMFLFCLYSLYVNTPCEVCSCSVITTWYGVRYVPVLSVLHGVDFCH